MEPLPWCRRLGVRCSRVDADGLRQAETIGPARPAKARWSPPQRRPQPHVTARDPAVTIALNRLTRRVALISVHLSIRGAYDFRSRRDPLACDLGRRPCRR